MNRRNLLAAAASLPIASLSARSAVAQGYPSRPVRLIDAFAPGSASDTILRLIAPHLQEALGQPVVVENRPGASGNVAARHLATVPADGHTFLMATNTMLTANPHLFPGTSIDPQKDVNYVLPVSGIGMVVFAGPAAPARDMQGVVARAKEKPGSVSYGTPGIGTPMHLIAELINQRTGAGLSHVPYKGGPPMVADVLGGQIGIGIVAYSVVAGFLQQGKLTPLAVTGSRRLAILPSVPALGELFPGIDISAWCALVAPKGTPAAAQQTFAAEAARALARPEVASRMRDLGLDRIEGGGAAVEALVGPESARLGELIRRLNIRME
ncbi:MAG: tripartite tricarboxylate transporter substrate binding protein [Burkholderiales bacterium]|nr:tripartite tricarboxylate transporter substrate binding protein [Burkholderiales bacterium]